MERDILSSPLGFRLLEAGPRHAIGVESDELDGNYIVRYALEPAVGT